MPIFFSFDKSVTGFEGKKEVVILAISKEKEILEKKLTIFGPKE
jgi:hypothetical protein